MSTKFDEEIDVSIPTCTVAIIRAKISIDNMDVGGILKVFAEKASADDVCAVFRRRQRVLAVVDHDPEKDVYIEKIKSLI